MPKKKDSYAVEFARKGGKASAKKLTPEQRAEKARKAAQARWSKAMGDNAGSKQRRDRKAGEQ
jgi:hypothetical protein